mgnify:CR=1 FL=1
MLEDALFGFFKKEVRFIFLFLVFFSIFFMLMVSVCWFPSYPRGSQISQEGILSFLSRR